jgi:hypothetical protein
MALMTSRLGTSSSSCFGALKSFLATRTPSIHRKQRSDNVSEKNGLWGSLTFEEVFVDNAPVLFGDNHDER